MRFVGKIIMLIFNDTEEKMVEKAIAALADMIPLEAIQPPQSPHTVFSRIVNQTAPMLSIKRRAGISQSFLQCVFVPYLVFFVNSYNALTTMRLLKCGMP